MHYCDITLGACDILVTLQSRRCRQACKLFSFVSHLTKPRGCFLEGSEGMFVLHSSWGERKSSVAEVKDPANMSGMWASAKTFF